jgi:hypothetical protein
MQGFTERQLTVGIIGGVIERLLLVGAGIFCIYIGYLLYVGGVSGNVKLRVETSGQKYQIENAAPGIVMGLFGTLILIRTTFRPFKLKDKSPEAGTRVVTLSDAPEQNPQVHLSLSEAEVHSLYKITSDVIGQDKVDPKVKTHIRKVYTEVYNQLPGLPDEFAPDRLP